MIYGKKINRFIIFVDDKESNNISLNDLSIFLLLILI